MDLTYYEDIKITSLKKQMSVIFAINLLLKVLNVNDALLYAALPASIICLLVWMKIKRHISSN